MPPTDNVYCNRWREILKEDEVQETDNLPPELEIEDEMLATPIYEIGDDIPATPIVSPEGRANSITPISETSWNGDTLTPTTQTPTTSSSDVTERLNRCRKRLYAEVDTSSDDEN